MRSRRAPRASRQGGNQVLTSGQADVDNRVQSYDQVWVKHIKAALMENRFRLAQQPVASLQGDDPQMCDVLVRMVDPQGKEVLPAEFMAAAERNDLLKNIDRWVVGASLSFAAQRRPTCLFVRLSKDTARDATLRRLAGWTHPLDAGGAAARLLPGHGGSRRRLPAGAHPRRRPASAGLPLRARELRLRPRPRRACSSRCRWTS